MEPTSATRYLQTLERLDIIEQSAPFGESPQSSKRSVYRIVDACFDFWFRLVMSTASGVEGGLGAALADQLPEQQLSDFLGRRFERLCAEWLLAQAAGGGQPPIPASVVGLWWGTNPIKRDLVRIYRTSHLYLFSRWPILKTSVEKYIDRPDVHFVTLEDIYL